MVELNQLAEEWWEHLRTALLVALARECKDGRGHESLLTDLVNAVYIAADRDQVRTALLWLHEKALVEAVVVSGAMAAKLTERGRDTAEGRRTVEGVKPPSTTRTSMSVEELLAATKSLKPI
ncbi:hypothetical protein [Niveispirillum sp. KHB5.9]|uniref:VpaChn25_0724 family phage protein n=1 Tax=Niveispirillum sp. KHB5.9 TaxID=3400269 RepID=UPI003A87EE5F